MVGQPRSTSSISASIADYQSEKADAFFGSAVMLLAGLCT
jgi:hypothetical protein